MIAFFFRGIGSSLLILAMAIIGMMSIFGNDFGRNPLDDRQCLVIVMFQLRDPKLIFQGFGLLFPDLELQCVVFFPEGILLNESGTVFLQLGRHGFHAGNELFQHLENRLSLGFAVEHSDAFQFRFDPLTLLR